MPIDLGLGLLEYGIRILGRIIWYDRIVNLAIDKLHDAIDEIAELRKQFIIVLRDEIPPFELAVGSLYGSKFQGQHFESKRQDSTVLCQCSKSEICLETSS